MDIEGISRSDVGLRPASCAQYLLLMVTIRSLTGGDAGDLATLIRAVDPDSAVEGDEGRAASEAFLADPASFVLGAYDGDRPIGFAWGLQMRSPSGRLTTYLHQLDVHANWRRQGAGTALTTAAMELGRRQGSTRFWLSTGAHNEGAQALYESIGGTRKPLGDVNYWWQFD